MTDDRDTPDGQETDLLGIGPAARALSMPVKRLRRLADQGRVPFELTEGRHRRFALDAVRRALGAHENAAPARPVRTPQWSRSLPLDGLDEDVVWRQLVAELALEPGDRAFGLTQYAFEEILNNAVDHSGGAQVAVDLWTPTHSDPTLRFRVSDDGVGVFARMLEVMSTDDPRVAALELTKGKFTTMPQRHSGQGIFFSSRAMDDFRLEANGLAFGRSAVLDDFALGTSNSSRGTTVTASVAMDTRRTMADVFGPFTSERGFDRTRPSMRLALSGDRFLSRAEARRVLKRLEEFTEVEVDFSGVGEVGQGFVDEMFGVWAPAHPQTKLIPMDMNPVVEFMVRRGLSDRGRSPF